MNEYQRWALRRVRRTAWLLSQEETRAPMANYLFDHGRYAILSSSRRALRVLVPHRSAHRGH